jgi:type IV pilus assembly protein PilV
MVIMESKFSYWTQRGSTMIEVLVTIVVLAIGLLGLAGLQSRLQVSEMEAYQRSQALLLLDDMASRIATNRNFAASYTAVAPVGTPLGAGMTCPTATTTRVQSDAKEWCDALQGAAEVTSGSAKVGALVGGRGCVESIGSGEYMVTVAWQGLIPISAPPASVLCGKDSYDGTGCTGDQCRRVVTTLVRVATL